MEEVPMNRNVGMHINPGMHIGDLALGGIAA
jgi:hypothetical protein